MTDDLVFYTHPMSRGRIVRWMLEEIGQPYRTELLEYGTTMKVPAIRHGGIVVTESPAICAYLADAFHAAGLAPSREDPQRGPYCRWLFFAAGPVEAAITNKALEVEIPARRERMAGYGTFAAMLDGLEAAVSLGNYLVGHRFSAADLYVGSQLGFGMRFGMIERRPAFEAYWARLNDRPAHQRAVEIDNALMPSAPLVN
jgi:glutathione S-transferase